MGARVALTMALVAGAQTDAIGGGAMVRIRTTGLVLLTIVQGGPRRSHERTDGSVRYVGVVRPTTQMLANAVEQGRRRSETLRALLDRLESSDLIVYLRVGSCPDVRSVACLSMVGANRAKRFVQITFVMQAHGDKTILAVFTDHLIAQVGHELQHAVEVADDPMVVDGPTLEAAYKQWGFRPDLKSTTYESEQAIRTGRAILNELQSTKPSIKRDE
jgi:hypothetical protein